MRRRATVGDAGAGLPCTLRFSIYSAVGWGRAFPGGNDCGLRTSADVAEVAAEVCGWSHLWQPAALRLSCCLGYCWCHIVGREHAAAEPLTLRRCARQRFSCDGAGSSQVCYRSRGCRWCLRIESDAGTDLPHANPHVGSADITSDPAGLLLAAARGVGWADAGEQGTRAPYRQRSKGAIRAGL